MLSSNLATMAYIPVETLISLWLCAYSSGPNLYNMTIRALSHGGGTKPLSHTCRIEM